MDEVQIKVVDAPPLELLPRNGLDPLRLVEGVPELGNDEEILALDESLRDGALDALAALLLIAVVEGAVEKSVAGLDGVVDGLGWVLGDLPEAESARAIPLAR